MMRKMIALLISVCTILIILSGCGEESTGSSSEKEQTGLNETGNQIVEAVVSKPIVTAETVEEIIEETEQQVDSVIIEEKEETAADIQEETAGPDGEEGATAQPSDEEVYSLTAGLSNWAVNAMCDWANEDSAATVGPVYMSLERAGLLAAYYCYESMGEEAADIYLIPGVGSYIPDEMLENALHNLFGSEYQLSDLRNAVIQSQDGIDESLFTMDNCSNTDLFLHLFLYNDQFCLAVTGSCYTLSSSGMSVGNIEKSAVNDNGYMATVDYMMQYYIGDYEYDETGYPHAVSTGPDAYATSLRTFRYEIVPDSGSEYGWVITQVTYDNTFHDS